MAGSNRTLSSSPDAPAPRRRVLGLVLFVLGFVAAVALTALTVWGDLEASLFDTSVSAETSLQSLSCPVFIVRDETGHISASFTNTGERAVERAIRVHISDGRVSVMREERVQEPLEPGVTARLRWPVTVDDAAYGYLILARVSTLRQFPMPSESSSCGVLVLGLPWGNGLMALVAWLALSLAGMIGGGWLYLADRTLRVRRPRTTVTIFALGIVAVAGLVAGLLGAWTAGVLVLALTFLLLIALFAQTMLAE